MAIRRAKRAICWECNRNVGVPERLTQCPRCNQYKLCGNDETGCTVKQHLPWCEQNMTKGGVEIPGGTQSNLDTSVFDARLSSMTAEIEKLRQKMPPQEHIYIVKHSDGTTAKVTGTPHFQFDELMHLCQLKQRKHIYMYGSPGTGKSTAGAQVADALKMKCGYISLTPQSPKSELFGFMSGMTGKYIETEFYLRFRDGGIFIIDELDNGSAQLLVALNGALENGVCGFPCGPVKRHKNFICIGTGNTVGLGANRMFPNRQPMDGAFRERFLFLEWEIDMKLERTIALGIHPSSGPWIDWVQTVRAFCKTAYPQLLVTQRASMGGATLFADGHFTAEKIAHMTVFKGIDPDSIRAILQRHPLPKVKHA